MHVPSEFLAAIAEQVGGLVWVDVDEEDQDSDLPAGRLRWPARQPRLTLTGPLVDTGGSLLTPLGVSHAERHPQQGRPTAVRLSDTFS